MRKICFITGSRADYGIMSTIMKKVKESEELDLLIVATNMHLSQKYGSTANEILNDGFKIDYRVDSDLTDNSAKGTVSSMAATMKGLTEAFESLKPDMVVILGDRFEALAAASAASVYNIPIAHIHGGEISEGAYDDNFRHAITKLSNYHFAATEEYASRIIQMGEKPENVFNTGALGVENILNTPLSPVDQLEDFIGLKLNSGYFVVTFHPVTREPGLEKQQTIALVNALEYFISRDNLKFIMTLPNSDTGADNVASVLKEWAAKFPENVACVKSLGRKLFFTALAGSKGMIGNSSAGLIEAPCFAIPTVNIGDRQKGRTKARSIIDSEPEKEAIIEAVNKALSSEFGEYLKTKSLAEITPYYKEGTSSTILSLLKTLPLTTNKTFHDLNHI